MPEVRSRLSDKYRFVHRPSVEIAHYEVRNRGPYMTVVGIPEDTSHQDVLVSLLYNEYDAQAIERRLNNIRILLKECEDIMRESRELYGCFSFMLFKVTGEAHLEDDAKVQVLNMCAQGKHLEVHPRNKFCSACGKQVLEVK